MKDNRREDIIYTTVIGVLIALISYLHYTTPTTKWQYHLIFMQSYFVPIILAAFRFGVRGGLGSSLAVSALYLPHIMFHWGGLVENNLMRFMQLILFNVVGYLTGLKAQGERTEKERYQKTAEKLQEALDRQQRQSERISVMEHQLRAADRLAIVGELTASLAHEVRNPLASIRGAVEIIRDEAPSELKESEFFSILINETERLNRVVENYLDFARKKSKKAGLFDFKEELKNILVMLGAQARKTQVVFKSALPESSCHISGDSNQFWQVVINVLLNAIQAMPQGGEVLLKTEIINNNRPKIRLSIKDHGTGMDKREINNIFRAFYTTKSNGSGLGLSIVKRIIDENNWHIDVRSKLGEGTEFILEIPCKDKKNKE